MQELQQYSGGQLIAVVGNNASGKTQMFEKLRRQWASDSVRYISFDDAYGGLTDKQYYLQLRWNQHDIDPETPSVEEFLRRSSQREDLTDASRNKWFSQLSDTFSLKPLMEKSVVMLSSGETRKLELIRALLSHPRTLIIDNPFIGLDSSTRQQLTSFLETLAHRHSITVYLLLSRRSDIPEKTDKTLFITCSEEETSDDSLCRNIEATISQPIDTGNNPSTDIVEMNDVSVSYGSHTILKNQSWHIRRGERWALLGSNGSGKSTLLSLISADNPQAYAHDITLFGRRRGSGETIWQIKRRIGYVSPELHRSYRRRIEAVKVVASGLKDTVGLYVRATEEERLRCLKYMRLFGVEHLADRPFMSLSSGEQRLVLLARAFVKNPELLILDEPFHGLDERNMRLVRHIVETAASNPLRTLIIVSHYADELPSSITNIKNLSSENQ